jgi:hypothetical protein
VKRIFLLLFFTLFFGCQKQEGPTGYKAGPSFPGDSNVVETCDEEDFIGLWWAFETNNLIANTVVPFYDDYCTYIEEDLVFFWNLEEEYGFYNYDYFWKCANENTMHIIDDSTGDVIEMRIYGSVGDGCYDVKISYDFLNINGNICPCEYNGP